MGPAGSRVREAAHEVSVSEVAGLEKPAPHGVAKITGALSAAAAGAATVAVILAGTAIVVAVVANIVRRELTGESIYGAEEFARFMFLWIIWMGVSLAVRRGAVTVITLVSERGPWWWRAAVHGLASGALGDPPGLRLLALDGVRACRRRRSTR